MTTEASREGGTLPRFAPRNIVGVVLFVAWGIATIMWVASTINLAADGDNKAIITAVAALATALHRECAGAALRASVPPMDPVLRS